jgi:hypothetical protein
MFFLITPINIVVLCPTIVIIPLFIFELLLFKSQTITIQLLLSRHWTVTVQPLLSWHWTVTVRPLLRFLTISRVIQLHFKKDWSRWKAKTRGYKFSKGRRTQLCLQDSQNFSLTNIRLLLSNRYCLDIELLLSDLSSDF